jgi:type 2 lantibiotic biosynthesis protein LanM
VCPFAHYLLFVITSSISNGGETLKKRSITIMPLSSNDLRTLAGKASTLPERLKRRRHLDDAPLIDEKAQELLSVWCQASTGGDWRRFEERLSWDGLDLAQATALLTPGSWPEQVELPAWTATLQDALHLLKRQADEGGNEQQETYPFLDVNKPSPFEDLLAPFVSIALYRFQEQAGAGSDLLSTPAHLALQQHLMQVLTSLALETFYAEFSKTRTKASASENGKELDEQSLYQQFLGHMRRGGLGDLLLEYSVLARLLATACDCWVEANVEFVQRLLADWSALEQMFGGSKSLKQVTEILPALSDAHAGRRSMMALTFDDSIRVVYKPRSVGIEQTFYKLLNWCNEYDANPDFPLLKFFSPRLLNRCGYGWMEFVAAEPCHDQQAMLRYWQRAGMLLCLVYILGGKECFFDHMIAHGEHPVLVDASALLQPLPNPDLQEQEEDLVQEFSSVLGTRLLTTWQVSSSASLNGKPGFDISGLGLEYTLSGLIQENGRRREQGVGRTQDIASTRSPSILKYGALKPRRMWHIASASDLTEPIQRAEVHEALCTGFQRMYQFLLRQRGVLLNATGPLQTLRTQVVRIAYRNRQSYERLLFKLLEPQALRDALMRSLLLERPGLECVPVEPFSGYQRNRSHWWQVFAAEREALLQGDIPAFCTSAESKDLQVVPSQVVASCFSRSGFDLLISRLEKLSERDMRQQLALIQRALHREIEPASIKIAKKVQTTLKDTWTGRDALMVRALAIANDLAGYAIEIEREGITWVHPTYSLRSQYYHLQPMGNGLSDGLSGVAFFLAAFARSCGISRYRHLALAAIQPLRHLVHDKGEQLAREICLGAGPGLGSIIYALTRISQFLDEPELLADARAVASLVTRERIANDELLDVFLGAAGSILGLLTLYETSSDPEILDRAILCGQHLLHARTVSKVGCRVWPTLAGAHTTGFAHGTAGIVYALLRLYKLTGDADLLEAAQEGLRYEDHALMREMGNWREEVGQGEEEGVGVPGLSWCHGAPGIGLARLGGLPMLDAPPIRRDIEIALQTTQQIGVEGPDHLCCGTCGRIDLLLTASQCLGRPELAAVASDWLGQILARAEQRGVFLLNPALPWGVTHPQLFQGMAGLGYTMLRMALPDTLPSVLLWQ